MNDRRTSEGMLVGRGYLLISQVCLPLTTLAVLVVQVGTICEVLPYDIDLSPEVLAEGRCIPERTEHEFAEPVLGGLHLPDNFPPMDIQVVGRVHVEGSPLVDPVDGLPDGNDLLLSELGDILRSIPAVLPTMVGLLPAFVRNLASFVSHLQLIIIIEVGSLD